MKGQEVGDSFLQNAVRPPNQVNCTAVATRKKTGLSWGVALANPEKQARPD
jgi:hypothetical protein